MLPLFSSFVKRTSDSVSSTAVANESISVAVVVVTKSSVSESNTTLSARHAIASIASSPSCSPLALNGSDFPSTESLSPPKSQIATSSTLFSCGFRLLQTLKSRIHRLTGSASTGIKGASDNQKRQIVRDHQVPSDPLTKAKQLFDQYLLANNPHLSNSSSCSSLSTTGDLDSLTDHSSLHIPDAHCRTSVPRPPAHSAPIPSNSTRPFPTNVTSGRRDSTSNDYHLGTTLERPTHRVVRLPPAKHYNHFQAPSHRHCRSSSRSGSSRSGSSTNEPFMPTISRTIVASPTCLKFSRLRFVRTAADHFRQAQSLLQLDFESFPTNERFVVNDPKSFCDLHSQSTGLKSNVDRTVIDRSRSWPDLQKTKQMSQIEQQQLQPLIEKKKTPKHESGATFASASVCGLPKLSFKCRLAHSNEMKSLSGFNTMVELYEKISKAFNLPINQILYCTLNTRLVDMERLLGGQIGVNDTIYVHCRNKCKEVEVMKSDHMLGLTITDNGNGLCFIKKIRPNSIIDRIRVIRIGDHIEAIDGQNLIGYRHFEVTKVLKDIEIGRTFVIRLVQPQAEDGAINSDSPIVLNESSDQTREMIGNGIETIRIRNNQQNGTSNKLQTMFGDQKALLRINSILEQFMGIADDELALSIWEIGQSHRNPHDFLIELQKGELSVFQFNQDLIFDLWGAVHDTVKSLNRAPS